MGGGGGGKSVDDVMYGIVDKLIQGRFSMTRKEEDSSIILEEAIKLHEDLKSLADVLVDKIYRNM